MPRHIQILSAALFGMMALSACDRSEPAAPAPDAQTRPAAAPAPRAAEPAAPTAAKDYLLHLATGGLQLVDPAEGTTKDLAFGTAERAILAALTPIRGEPVRERDTENDCGLTNLVYADGLTLSFEDDVFAGWRQDERGETLSTMNGIHVGMTRAALTAAASPDFTRIGGMEAFTIGDLAGVMDGGGGQAKIQSLYAGEPCIAS